MFKWIKSYMPKRLYYRAALILVLPVVLLQLIVSIVFIQRHFEGVTVQMTRTVAAELDLITEVIEKKGAVAAQQIANVLGAKIYAFGPSGSGLSKIMLKLIAEGYQSGGEGIDDGFDPDHLVKDGDFFMLNNEKITAIYTPGHMGNHICYQYDKYIYRDHFENN